tara:strand:+ start:198 stop:401 length:204 start_codon:yes stop_codon:yes gene_type:complete
MVRKKLIFGFFGFFGFFFVYVFFLFMFFFVFFFNLPGSSIPSKLILFQLFFYTVTLLTTLATKTGIH